MANILTQDQLFRAAPSVFATSPWEGCSDKYTFIPTIDAVRALESEGFYPVKAFQSRSRIPGKKEFTKHLLRFRRDSDLNAERGQEVPEIVLVNSHDKTSSYQLSAGLFRVVCSNGLVAKTGEIDDIRVSHSGNVLHQVVEGSCRIIEEAPKLIEHVNAFKSITLSIPQQEAYARAALSLRYDEDDNGNSLAPIVAEKLLNIRRFEDRKSDLWTTFNVVQENLIRGGLRGRTVSAKRTSTRAINGVSENVKLNKALWVLTEELAKIVN